ncbi:hypothetical protein A4D02_21535 [Niastella koreensis]|uniref:Lipocalin-like domain-containing protein n=2 Tax=Niastella koreensis TaxID=354356 RepID=G8THX7_NIAKG|nr:lipocalin family protein [Niastella koreensis]AEV98572.1 hypothetical protein Niako_2217 [Niastella koreensis GR20-10]OQP52987.1 hypothetical protein A4D02_21535 [Niastella koreensis]
MKKIVLSVLALSALVFSCKKDDDKKSTRDQLLGKWNFTSEIENHHYSGKDHFDTTKVPAGYATIEFKSNDSCIQIFNNQSDNSTFKVDGSSLIFKYTNNSDTVTVKSVTGSELKIWYKDPYTADEWYEYTDVFNK